MVRQGDALTQLELEPSGWCRCFVTSPPYRNKFFYGSDGECGQEESMEDYIAYQLAVAKQMRRCATEDANLFFVIGDSYNGSGGAGGDYRQAEGGYGAHACRGAREKGWPRKAQLLVPERIRLLFTQVGWVPILRVVWNQNDSRRGAIDRPSYSYEEVLIFAANPDHYWDRGAVLTPYAKKSLPQLRWEYKGKARHPRRDGTEDPSDSKRRMMASMKARKGAYLRAVWDLPSGSQPVVEVEGKTVRGVASFPLLLAEICINLGSAPGDYVCDPFAGMGTTMVAAQKWGRFSLGFELNPLFCRAARARLRRGGVG